MFHSLPHFLSPTQTRQPEGSGALVRWSTSSQERVAAPSGPLNIFSIQILQGISNVSLPLGTLGARRFRFPIFSVQAYKALNTRIDVRNCHALILCQTPQTP